MKIYQNRSQLLEQLNQICIQTLKEKISNKYTNEVNNGNETDDIVDSNYTKQIETIIK